MAWAAIVATAISAYASSREQDEQREANRDDSIEMLRERYRLDREDREAERQYRSNAYDGWGAYGIGGAQGGMWNQPTPNYQGLLSPSNFRSQYGSGPVAMPWGQPPQQNNRGRR